MKYFVSPFNKEVKLEFPKNITIYDTTLRDGEQTPGVCLGTQEKLEIARKPITKCYNCLEKCEPRSVPYCITKALIDAVRGDVENGLVFCGENVDRIQKMTTVHELMQELCYGIGS